MEDLKVTVGVVDEDGDGGKTDQEPAALSCFSVSCVCGGAEAGVL